MVNLDKPVTTVVALLKDVMDLVNVNYKTSLILLLVLKIVVVRIPQLVKAGTAVLDDVSWIMIPLNFAELKQEMELAFLTNAVPLEFVSKLPMIPNLVLELDL